MVRSFCSNMPRGLDKKHKTCANRVESIRFGAAQRQRKSWPIVRPGEIWDERGHCVCFRAPHAQDEAVDYIFLVAFGAVFCVTFCERPLRCTRHFPEETIFLERATHSNGFMTRDKIKRFLFVVRRAHRYGMIGAESSLRVGMTSEVKIQIFALNRLESTVERMMASRWGIGNA